MVTQTPCSGMSPERWDEEAIVAILGGPEFRLEWSRYVALPLMHVFWDLSTESSVGENSVGAYRPVPFWISIRSGGSYCSGLLIIAAVCVGVGHVGFSSQEHQMASDQVCRIGFSA